MDQIKVEAFLKGLRKEKGITQEQFADTLFFIYGLNYAAASFDV